MSKIAVNKPGADEMCAVGYHVVRDHQRTCRSGTKTWVDAHNAKNPKQSITDHLKENLHYLYWNADVSAYGKLKTIKGYPVHHEIDGAIQFWLKYWESQGLSYPKDLDPLIIKAIIAVESSFNASATSSKSTATGLMQVTNKTRLDLAGRKQLGYRFVRYQLITIDQIDLKDPLINIAAGTRWLAAKFSALSSGSERNTYNMLKAYNEWNERGDASAKKVLQLYNQSK